MTSPPIDVHLPRRLATHRELLRTARRFNVLNAGRRYGKTTVGVDLAVNCVLDGFPVAWTSMTYKNQNEVWRAMTSALQPVATRMDGSAYRIDTMVPGGSFEAWSWTNVNAMRGRKYKLVIVDEAAHIDGLLDERDSYTAVVRPTLLDLVGDAWFLSSPNGHNDFEALWERGQSLDWPDWQSWTRTTADNPLIAPDEIASMRHEMSELLAAQELDAQFVDLSDVDPFLPDIALWDACQEVLPPLGTREPMVLALDAGVTNDSFAVVGVTQHPTDRQRQAVRLVQVYEPHGTPLDFDVIEAFLLDLVERVNVVCIVYDAYQLHQMGTRLGRRVWAESFSQGADRLVADKSLRDRIITRQIAHHDQPVLRDHIRNARAKIDKDGTRLRIVKASASRKIDAAVALSMASHRLAGLNL